MAPKGSKVTSLPLTARRALELIRNTAQDSSRVVNTLVFREDERWFELVTTRQVQLCLKEGELLGDPMRDQHGNWVCRLHRLCGGVDVIATIAIANDNDGQHKLYITEVAKSS